MKNFRKFKRAQKEPKLSYEKEQPEYIQKI